jgi:hypothetical protein
MRESAEFLKETRTGPFFVAEIGVYQGENALDMLEGLNIGTISLVDPYEDGLGYDPAQEESNIHPMEARLIAMARLEKHESKIIWCKVPSLFAAQVSPDYFDYVYIDGDHRYEAVSADIRAWWQKIKSGGILAGHDYRSTYRPDIHQGIDKAVEEFAEHEGLEIHSKGLDWWVIKP